MAWPYVWLRWRLGPAWCVLAVRRFGLLRGSAPDATWA